MTRAELTIAANTLWVVVAATLVIFMQAGFAFLEAGLTRMKNAAHVAAKNVLIFGIASLVYWAVGFGIAFGDGGGPLIGGSGFFPSGDDLLGVAQAPFSFFSTIPGAAAYLFQVAFAGVSLAIVWGAMAERTKLWVYFAFGAAFVGIYSVVSHWIWHADGWLFALGMQDFAGSTVVHYQGALAALAGALLLGPRIGKFGADGRANPIPGHNLAFVTLGVLILWFGWFGFNPGSALGVASGDRVGFFAYVAMTTNLAAAAGALGGVVAAWLVIGKPDLSMMLNGVVAALVAVTAACGFVAPWAAIVIGGVAGAVAVGGVLLVERLRIDDPVGALAVHGMAGVWGTLATGLFAVPALAQNLAVGQGGFVYTGSLRQVGIQLLGLAAVGAFTFGASFGVLWTFKRVWGIRVEAEVETAGLDVSEHGMWGYPEFYIPVPGGYGTESHGHLLGGGHRHESLRPAAEPEAA
jgi:ammonium transporter, Amt family